MLIRSQAHIDIEMWPSFIMHLWRKQLLQQQKASNPMSARYQPDRKSNSRNTLFSFFSQMWLQKTSVNTVKLSSAFLCVSWISIEHSLKRDELVKCEQFHKNIFHLYRYIQIHHEMWISFYPPKSPNMWNYKFMCFEPLVKLQIKH